MPKNNSIDDVIADGERIIRVWRENPAFSMGTVTLAQLETMITDLRTLRGQIEDSRTELTQLVNQSNDKLATISSVASRARSGFRAFFGPDSSQYEQAGGTRSSERKRRTSSKKQS
jgi:hypothetical protein